MAGHAGDALEMERMKTNRFLNTAALAVALSVACLSGEPSAPAAELRLDSLTVDGGCGVSRGKSFTLIGTTGQSEAGLHSAGALKLEGGFWHGVSVVQTPGAPKLRVQLVADGRILLAWPVAVTGFVVEQCTDLTAATWSPTPRPVADTASEHTVTIPASGIVRCYRLKQVEPSSFSSSNQ